MSRPEDIGDSGGFLSRWAKRKQEAKRLPPEPALVPEPPAASAIVEAEPEPLPLPLLDDIAPGRDVTAFLQKHVPEALRTAALRKLWVTDPAIRDFIEMADYQWDFNNPDAIPGWASTLDDVDVKAMAERIFRTGSAAAEDRPSPAADAAPPSQSPDDGEPDSASNETDENSPAISAPLPANSTFVEASPENCAAQNNPSASSIYAAGRKRHGGALPT